MSKVCCRCKTEKQLTDFHKQTRSKDGRRSECIMCAKEYLQIRKANFQFETTHKTCNECELDLPISCFKFYYAKCKKCMSNIAKEKTLRIVNSDIYQAKTVQCLHCNEKKPFDDFPKDIYRKDKIKHVCKVCNKAHKKILEESYNNIEYNTEGKVKECTQCHIVKQLVDFYRDKAVKNGFKSKCKKCLVKNKKDYRRKHLEKVRESDKRYRQTESYKLSRLKQHERLYRNNKQYRIRNVQNIRIRESIYRKNNRERINKEVRKRLSANTQAKIAHNLRARFHDALKRANIGKTCSILKLMGCTTTEVKAHLENQFKDGMTWDNYGKWHIDHIVPVASYDLSDYQQQCTCFHYTNLQPLWSEDNLKKGKKA